MKLELAFNLTDNTCNGNIFEWDAKLKRMPVCKLNSFVNPREIFNTIKKEGIYKGMKAGIYSLPISSTFKMALEVEPLGDGSYVLCAYEPKLPNSGGIDFSHKYTFMYFGKTEIFESRVTCCERPLTTIFDNLTERSLFECGVSLDYLLDQITEAKCSQTTIKYLKGLIQSTTVTVNGSTEGQDMTPELKLIPNITFIETVRPNTVIYEYPGVRHFALRELGRLTMYEDIIKGVFDVKHHGLLRAIKEDKSIHSSEFLEAVNIRIERAFIHFTFKFTEGADVEQKGIVIRDTLTQCMCKMKATLNIHPTSAEQTITFALLDTLGKPTQSIASVVRMYHWFKANVPVEVVLDVHDSPINDEGGFELKYQDTQTDIDEPQSPTPTFQDEESTTPNEVDVDDSTDIKQPIAQWLKIPVAQPAEENHMAEEEHGEDVSLFESMIKTILKFEKTFGMVPSSYTLAEIISRDHGEDALEELENLTSRQVYTLAESLGLADEKATVFNEYIMQFVRSIEQQ